MIKDSNLKIFRTLKLFNVTTKILNKIGLFNELQPWLKKVNAKLKCKRPFETLFEMQASNKILIIEPY